MMLFGYVITDTRAETGGFWTVAPRLVTGIANRYLRWHVTRTQWDYWSVKDELTYRKTPKKHIYV